ncbi:tRNA (adenosine(37)-N6)-dimethylallyltransferase MiaA [Deinococcus irradiatisoli]|uniref:tRNA dimethylallyltransferase n=1 Tax=Deinococcus irradiatisoli TaxID=2202254 RepID=A0A2Z3JDQ5_9DEIO|nr:tRNA (adenosine(37)-N6)-dimethylallyltransferase MiaA [Deinococcus irradiatisoli]AWN23172.1 tRNA (adenosine(37)-N6)-dimethylallyltransferase MiaA [Deinococcus irradiatisoli]
MPLPFPGPLLPILTAPTAAGKSALALQLAREFPLEILSADAFTVYRGLDIGTAKPTPQDRAEVPHHLIDVADVREPYDVARWLSQAEAAIAGILARGNWPLIVGGTGFYLSALRRGLPLTPPSDPAERALIEQELAERGLDALLSDIAALNPQEAARMERNPRRVVRALEIQRRTGRFPGEFGYTRPRYAYQVFAFSPPDLEERIARRVRAMLEEGWPAEASWLAQQVSPELSPRPTVWQALGYAEALALARDELTFEQAERQITQATRQYAKRQITWARTQLGAQVQSEDEVRSQLAALLHSRLSPDQ